MLVVAPVEESFGESVDPLEFESSSGPPVTGALGIINDAGAAALPPPVVLFPPGAESPSLSVPGLVGISSGSRITGRLSLNFSVLII